MTQPTRLEVRANMQLTDEQRKAIETAERVMADAGFTDTVIGLRSMLAASPAAPAQSAEPVSNDQIAKWARRMTLPLDDSECVALVREILTSPQPSPTAVVLDDERAAFPEESVQFEKWFSTKKEYAHGWSPRYAAIEGWQARAAPQPVAQPVELDERATPAAQWRVRGEKDPMGDQYDCERASLTLGKMTDDELANAVYLHDHRSFDLAAIQRGEPPSIALLTAAKERIRWLSRALEQARAATPQPVEQTRALTGWQPIETAPMDGTVLILFARAKHATASAPVFGWCLSDLGWVESAFSPNHPVGIVPSHWMPRPEFPTAARPASGETE